MNAYSMWRRKMERNAKIARQLIGLAKELVSMSKFSDGLGEDSDNSNSANDAQYEEILKQLYDAGIAGRIINEGHSLDSMAEHKGTMGNGNLFMKYETVGNTFIIMGLVSKRKSFARKGDMKKKEDRKLYEQDKQDIRDLFKFLEKQVNDGYVISTSCNRFSLVFMKGFYELHKGEYQISYSGERDAYGMSSKHGTNNMSKMISVWKKGMPGENLMMDMPGFSSDPDHIYDIDEEFENKHSEHPRTNEQVRRIQQRREQELINIVKEREGK